MAVNLSKVPWEFTAANDTASSQGHKGTVPLGKIVCRNGSGVPANFIVRDESGGHILFGPISVAASGGEAERDFPPGSRVEDIFIDTIPATSFVYVYPRLPT